MSGKIVHIALKVKDMESSTKFYQDVFGFREVATHRSGKSEAGHVSRHMTDGVIDLALMVYDSEDAPEAQLSGTGPCIHHWGAEVDDIKSAAEKIKELGGEIMSPARCGRREVPCAGRHDRRAVPEGSLRELQEAPRRCLIALDGVRRAPTKGRDGGRSE